MQKQILIIGAGLTGLLLAYRLKKEGINVKVLEARDRIGGRIHTIYTEDNTPIEMGATWLGPQHTALIALLKELKIPVFPQFIDGKVFYQPSITEPPQEIYLPKNETSSYRIQGGTSALILKLAASLTKDELILNTSVSEILFKKENVQVLTEHKSYTATNVISTLPPKLLVESIIHSPSLPESLLDISKNTHTWMGTSIKFGVSYKTPFWRKNGYSGTIYSTIGPITEAYDHTNTGETRYALKGFIQNTFANEDIASRKARVIDQLQACYGAQALAYTSYKECVWQDQIYTSVKHNNYIFPHQNNGHTIYKPQYYTNRYIIAGSETASQYGGYMEGAVRSAHRSFKLIIM